jgi:RNA polymerase sigma factor (sigma-70 family)
MLNSLKSDLKTKTLAQSKLYERYKYLINTIEHFNIQHDDACAIYNIVMYKVLKFIDDHTIAELDTFFSNGTSDNPLRSLITKSTQNETIAYLRSKKVSQNKLPLDDVEDLSELIEDDSVSTYETINLLEQSLESIPERYRQLLIFNVMYGYNYKELAKQFNISPNAVKLRIARARDCLRQN